jgi:hypothetical protein
MIAYCRSVQNLNNSTSLAGTLGKTQTRFDRFLPTYREMVNKSRIILNALQKSRTTFLFDLQCIMPLYIIGRKCRDPTVRRQAIGLLLQQNWREGVWDSTIAGKIAQWVMEIEEEGMVDGFVPEWCRVGGAEVTYDMRDRSANLKCLRRVSEGSDKMAVREVHLTW